MRDQDLYDALVERLLEDSDALGDAVDVVEAALRGDEALRAALAGETAALGMQSKPRARSSEAWLRRIALGGLRGVGPQVELRLAPEPGLVLVVGRNGSGKSSFCDGLELALTGRARRFEGRGKVWQTGWRNLHEPDAPWVEVELAVRGGEPVRLRRAWAADTELRAAELSVFQGLERLDGLAALGWERALAVSRPLLGTMELARGLDKGPVALFEALAGILGLGEVEAGVARLQAVEREARQARTAVGREAKALRAELLERSDPRGAEAAAALKGRRHDLDGVERLVLGQVGAEDPHVAALQRLAALRGPDSGAVETAAVGWVAAHARVEEAARVGSAADATALEVLEAALRWHEAAGDGACPVCGAAPLDAAWAERAGALVRARTEAQAELRDARAQRDRAAAELRRLVPDLPGPLSGAPLDVELAREAWEGARAAAEREPRRVVEAVAELELALDDLRERAVLALREREDAWRPVGLRLAAWLERAREVERLSPGGDRAKRGLQWLREAGERLRAERFAPIARHTQQIWSLLRQDSSVQVRDVVLAGRGKQRHVEVQVAMDGAEGAALGVMSQGELNALALSLFLPRMMLPGSPFRFLVVDDPVQAMDPHKVDGLARVLGGVAETHQVVVLTHDPRLEEAVRRLQVPVRVVEVLRRGASVLELRDRLDPVSQQLHDARHVARHAAALGAVARRVVPGMCRAAVEQAAAGVVRRRRIGQGEAHGTVAQLLRGRTTMQLLALALHDDPSRGGDVYTALNRRCGDGSAGLVKELKVKAHGSYDGDLAALVRDSERLARRVGAL